MCLVSQCLNISGLYPPHHVAVACIFKKITEKFLRNVRIDLFPELEETTWTYLQNTHQDQLIKTNTN